MTVGDLATYLPTVNHLLDRIAADPTKVIDRGIDRQRVSASLGDEYGWYLWPRTGGRFRRSMRGEMTSLIRDAGRRAWPVILKNPWDTGRETRLLRSFPTAKVVIMRRRLGAIQASWEQGLKRFAKSPDYLLAMTGNDLRIRLFLRALKWPVPRSVLLTVLRWDETARLARLLMTVRSLPVERVAFLSYDELKDDPEAAAAWAGHIVEPALLAAAFAESVDLRSSVREPRQGAIPTLLDRMWERAWTRAREAQVRAGILGPSG